MGYLDNGHFEPNSDPLRSGFLGCVDLERSKKPKKPNFLMKSVFLKNKSLTPQEKSVQKSLCPIYDFYNGFHSVFSIVF